MQATIHYHLHCIYNYLHSIYIVLGIISNLERIKSIQEDVCRLYANATPFYRRDLSILGLGSPRGYRGVLEPIPCRYQGMTVLLDEKARCQSLYIVCYQSFKRRKIKVYTYVLLCVIHTDHRWHDEQEAGDWLLLGRDIRPEDRVGGRLYTFSLYLLSFMPYECVTYSKG